MKRSYKVVLIILLQIIFLSGMIGFKYYTLHFGTPILLKASTVDPRDVFRGEYVRLRYELSSAKNFDPGKQPLRDETVYVVLEKGEKYWDAVGVYIDKPQLNNNQVLMKGKLNYGSIQYGIETYYVEEGKGREIERKNNMDVMVRVDRFGNAVIERIL